MHMELSPVRSVADQLRSPPRKGSQSPDYAVTRFKECAELHGPLVIQHIPRMVTSLLRALSSMGATPQFQQVCAGVFVGIAENAPRDSAQAVVVMGALCAPLDQALADPNDAKATGAATCLQALLASERWVEAGKETREEVFDSLAAALEAGHHACAHLRLASSLVRSSPDILPVHARTLLQAARTVLKMSGVCSERVDAARLLGDILPHTAGWSKGGALSEEVGAALAALEGAMDDAMLEVREEAMGVHGAITKCQRLSVPPAPPAADDTAALSELYGGRSASPGVLAADRSTAKQGAHEGDDGTDGLFMEEESKGAQAHGAICKLSQSTLPSRDSRPIAGSSSSHLSLPKECLEPSSVAKKVLLMAKGGGPLLMISGQEGFGSTPLGNQLRVVSADSGMATAGSAGASEWTPSAGSMPTPAGGWLVTPDPSPPVADGDSGGQHKEAHWAGQTYEAPRRNGSSGGRSQVPTDNGVSKRLAAAVSPLSVEGSVEGSTGDRSGLSVEEHVPDASTSSSYSTWSSLEVGKGVLSQEGSSSSPDLAGLGVGGHRMAVAVNAASPTAPAGQRGSVSVPHTPTAGASTGLRPCFSTSKQPSCASPFSIGAGQQGARSALGRRHGPPLEEAKSLSGASGAGARGESSGNLSAASDSPSAPVPDVPASSCYEPQASAGLVPRAVCTGAKAVNESSCQGEGMHAVTAEESSHHTEPKTLGAVSVDLAAESSPRRLLISLQSGTPSPPHQPKPWTRSLGLSFEAILAADAAKAATTPASTRRDGGGEVAASAAEEFFDMEEGDGDEGGVGPEDQKMAGGSLLHRWCWRALQMVELALQGCLILVLSLPVAIAIAYMAGDIGSAYEPPLT